eukprot:COSAG04_NODE_12820_length_633_cov_1.061798_2_plen_61_part_01
MRHSQLLCWFDKQAKDVRRGRYVTSDSDAIETAYASHHYVATAAEAACGGVKDGQCDINSG